MASVPPVGRVLASRDELRQLPPYEAYARVVETDTLRDYQWFVDVNPSYRLSPQVWVIIETRREAILWRRAVYRNSPRAYWNYLKRYPDGPHAEEARALLTALTSPPMPPPDYVVAPEPMPAGWWDEAVGLVEVVPQGYDPPPPVFDELPPVFLVRLVLQIDLIVLIAATAGEIDHVRVTRILRKEHCLFAQAVVIEIVVELAIGKMIGVQEVRTERRHAFDQFFEFDFERVFIERIGRGHLQAGVLEQRHEADRLGGFVFEHVPQKFFFHVGGHRLEQRGGLHVRAFCTLPLLFDFIPDAGIQRNRVRARYCPTFSSTTSRALPTMPPATSR